MRIQNKIACSCSSVLSMMNVILLIELTVYVLDGLIFDLCVSKYESVYM